MSTKKFLCLLSLFFIVFVFEISDLISEDVYAAKYDDFDLIFLDSFGVPITTSIDVRYSLWDSYDMKAGDIDVNGAINTSSIHYGGFQYVGTIIPGYSGVYEMNVLDIPGFPDPLGTNNYLFQVEYKTVGAPDTDFVLLDLENDPPFNNIQRRVLLRNISYFTADAGPRTNYNTFILDANDNAPTQVAIQFGESLAKTLSYHKSNARFEFNDDVNIAGLLTGLTGFSSSGVVDFSLANVGIGTASPVSALHVADGYYAQFEDNNAGAPVAVDCDSDTERGRISIDTTNNRLYICNGSIRGWDYIPMTD